MNISACYKIGRIVKPHGVKGSVTVYIDPEAPANVDKNTVWYVEKQKRLIPLSVSSISPRGDRAFVTFEDVLTYDHANEYRQCDVYLPRSTRPDQGANAFYDDEVVGFAVYDVRSGALGTVSGSRRIGQSKLMVVNEGVKEILIPVNGPFIQSIERDNGKILVALPDGFLEI